MNTSKMIANRYEYIESLGQGGFGSVFKVKDVETDEILALKYLANGDRQRLDTRRFMREFQHLARLDHPHIVSVKDTGVDGSACYFTMEYLEGVTLEEALKSPDTGLYRVLQSGGDIFREILIQLCEALACIHANGLVHRDLKPANIFLQSDQEGPHAKILDLGMAKFRNDEPSALTEEGTMLGTVHYMSPEQIRGVHVDHRADLYTLGVVLYEVLTGQKPFLGQNSASVILKHLNEVPVPPRVYNLDIPHDLQLVVLKLLEKEPERRYRFANDLLADLVPSKSHSGRRISAKEPAMLLQHPRFLGRAEEMAKARGLLTDVQNGKGRALCISGPAGIGKTRFMEELKADAQIRGMQVLHAACYEDNTAPFQPIITAIRTAEQKLGPLKTWVRDEDKNELARLFPELGEIQETFNRSTMLSLNQEYIFVALMQLFKDLLHRCDLMLCIDDVQWIDQATEDFIAFLCSHLDLSPMALCLIKRLGGATFRFEEYATSIELGPLGSEGTDLLLTSMFSTEDLPKEFSEDVFELSGGNLFVTLEITKALFANKAIAYKGNKWTYQLKSKLTDIEKAIAWRVNLLSEKERNILHFATVLNRPFEFDIMASLLGYSEEELFTILERLVQYHFLKKDEEDIYFIHHSLFVQTLYHSLSLEKQTELHLRIAITLSQFFDSIETASEIARHFSMGGQESEAYPYLIRAGDLACQTYAFFDAKKNYKKALEIMRNIYNPTSESYLDIMCKYVDVLRWTRDWGNVKKHVGEILDLPDIPPYYYCWLVNAQTSQMMTEGKFDESEKLLRFALKCVDEPQYDKIKIQSYLNLSQFYWAKGNYKKATECTDIIVGICENAVEPFYRTLGNFVLGHDNLTNSRFRAAEIAFQEALEEFEIVHKDRRYSQACRAALREIYTYRGLLSKAELLSLKIIDNAKNTGLVNVEIYETVDLAYILFEQGRIEEAETYYHKTIDFLLENGDNHKLCLVYIRLGELYLSLQDHEQATHYVREAEKIAGTKILRQGQLQLILGKVNFAIGHVDVAEEHFEKSCEIFSNVKDVHLAISILSFGKFYYDVGKKEKAEELIGSAIQQFRKMGADHFLKKAQKVWNRIMADKQTPIVASGQSNEKTTLNTSQLLDEAIDRLLQVTHADRGLILTVENGQPRLQTACTRHLDADSLDDISSTVVQAAIESGTLIVTTDASQDPRFENSMSIADSNVGSILCMPLMSREKNIIGVVYADLAGDGVFTAQAISFFKSFAAFVAVGLEHALRSEQLQVDLEKFSGMRTQVGDLVGVSGSMQKLYDTIDQIARTDVPILLQGETGVGKGLVARTIHGKSHRADHPFLSVNCGALPKELLESELFGHKKGAFTGATEDRPGLFEAAQGGTLFLDEIGEAPPEVQVSLLHVLEEKMIRRVGENQTREVDVRIIAATNCDLEADVRAGKFRRDLYYRLNVMTLTIPPLRDRADDILLLAKHFLTHWNRELDKNVAGFESSVNKAFLQYDWPGNIRELDNAVYRGVTLAEDHIGFDHLPDVFQDRTLTFERSVPSDTLKAEVAHYEKELIAAALEANKWNVTATAEKLDISRVALGQKIKKYGLKRPQ